MRQIYVFLLLTICTSLALSHNLNAQCKYVREATDEWTQKATKTAQLTIGNGYAGREVILQESEGKLYLGLRLTYSTDFPDVPFKQGDKVTIKLANNELIEIAAQEDVAPSIIRLLDVPVRQWFIRQEVTPQVYKQLTASPIVAIKFHLNNNDYPLPEIKERQTKKVMDTAECMLANL